jgi:hypothetical protein
MQELFRVEKPQSGGQHERHQKNEMFFMVFVASCNDCDGKRREGGIVRPHLQPPQDIDLLGIDATGVSHVYQVLRSSVYFCQGRNGAS